MLRLQKDAEKKKKIARRAIQIHPLDKPEQTVSGSFLFRNINKFINKPRRVLQYVCNILKILLNQQKKK